MKKKNIFLDIIKAATLILAFSLFISSIVGCFDSGSNEISPTPSILIPTPDYLMFVTPVGIKTHDEYNESRSLSLILARGVSVSIMVQRMGISEENRNWETIRNRVSLFLNGEAVPNKTLVGGTDGEKGGGLFRISWAPLLETGFYIARFVFISDSGASLEYVWQFVIVEN